MKAAYLTSFCLLFISLLSCSKSTESITNTPDTHGKFEYLPTQSEVFISDSVTDSINTMISRLDSNTFSEGRTSKAAADTEMAQKAVQQARQNGGSSTGNTVFMDNYFDDEISVTLFTEYDKSSLKLLKNWERQLPSGGTEAFWTYSARIKVTYRVTVDGDSQQGSFFQQSQINSPLDLLL